jgi:hypothetical protein
MDALATTHTEIFYSKGHSLSSIFSCRCSAWQIASLIVASFCQTLVAYAAANDKSAFSPNPSGITEFINFP